MKTTKSFKLKRAYKYLITLLPSKDADQRGAFRRMMVQAQVIGNTRIKADPKKAWTTGTPSEGSTPA
jgi:hypothetical protein